MTVSCTYVGDLRGFDWNGNWNGNCPRSLSHAFPPIHGASYHSALEDWAKLRGIPVTQVDFDGYVARVSRAQLEDFIQHWYGSDPGYTDPDQMLRWEGRPYLVDKLERVRADVAALDPGGEYGLVSQCY